MSRFRCTCDHIIPDNTDDLPYKAYFLPDEGSGHALHTVMEEVAEFIEARERGEQAQFLRGRASLLPKPSNPAVRDILHQLFSHPTFEFGRWMYKCENCGRMWMEAMPGSSKLVSYQPESARRGILRQRGADPEA